MRKYLVTDHSNWALYWVMKYIKDSYWKNRFDVHSVRIENLHKIRNSLIHFVDRYAFFQNHHRLHQSNRIHITWFHGDPDVEKFDKLFQSMLQTQEKVEKIITSCGDSYRGLIRSGIPENKIQIIPIGVDLKKFTPGNKDQARKKLGLDSGLFIVGSFQKDGDGWDEGTNPKLEKGPDTFIQTIALIKDTIPGLFVLLTGPSRGYVKRELERLGVPYRHDFLDNYHDIVDYYRALDVYLISSRVEGGPKAMAESWATGIPLVTTDMGMPADYVKNGVNGFICDKEDTQCLASGILNLYTEKEKTSKMIAHGFTSVKDLDWRVIAKKYRQSWNETI